MPIRKRRPVKHLNKNEARLLRRAAQERQVTSAGSLLSRFPAVSHLEIQMEFVTHQGHLIGSEQRIFEGDDSLNFSVDCPGRCGKGRMDMEAIVKQMIQDQQNSRTSKGICKETLFTSSSETCNCELRCVITAQYVPVAAAG